MTDRELMQQALDVMEAAIKAGDWKIDGACDPDWVLNALRARLAQPEQDGECQRCNGSGCVACDARFLSQEPVAWFMERTFMDGTPSFIQVCETDPEFYVPLYRTPPQREWQGLTDEDIEKLVYDIRSQTTGVVATAYVARAIEAKLREKNT